jgi:hypothetical protein
MGTRPVRWKCSKCGKKSRGRTSGGSSGRRLTINKVCKECEKK